MKKNFPPHNWEIKNEEQMRQLGYALSQSLEAGDVLGLVGELGAGKTRLVQGVLQGLGSEIPAVSPTFALVQEHPDASLPTAHFDFYRLRSTDDALSMGWQDYLHSGMVLLVEWADRFDGSLMPPGTVWVVITGSGEEVRRVKIKMEGC